MHDGRMQVASSATYVLYDFALPECRCQWCSQATTENGFENVGWGRLIRIDSVRIEGQLIRSRIEDGKLWISYRCDGSVQSFCPIDILNENVDKRKELSQLWGWGGLKMNLKRYESLQTDLSIQGYLFDQLLVSYNTYGENGLKAFFDEGKEVKKKNLNMGIREIAGAMLLPAWKRREYKSFEKGAKDISERFTSFGEDIDPTSLTSSAKKLHVEENEYGNKR